MQVARLEDLVPAARVLGVLPEREVTVVQVEWHGQNALTLTYRTESGQAGEQLLYREDQAKL